MVDLGRPTPAAKHHAMERGITSPLQRERDQPLARCPDRLGPRRGHRRTPCWSQDFQGRRRQCANNQNGSQRHVVPQHERLEKPDAPKRPPSGQKRRHRRQHGDAPRHGRYPRAQHQKRTARLHPEHHGANRTRRRHQNGQDDRQRLNIGDRNPHQPGPPAEFGQPPIRACRQIDEKASSR